MSLPSFDPNMCGACCGEERADAAAHRVRLLQVARDLFDEHGVAAVSMRDVACAAGVGQGTLYRKFPSKGALAAALLADAVSSMEGRLVAAVAAAPTTPVDAFLGELVHFTAEHHELLAEAVGALSADVYLGDTPIWRWKRASLVELLQQQYPDAAFPVQRAAEILLDAQRPDRVAHAISKGNSTPEQIAVELSEVARRLMA